MEELRRYLFIAAVSVCLCSAPLYATYVYPFEIFTDNGLHNDDPGVDIFMEVFNGEGVCSFKFFNSSSVQSSITKIYFDDGSLLGIDSVANSAGVLFDRDGGPGNLPGGNELVPPFVANREFTIGADPPPYQNGVNNPPPDEWVTVTFNLINGGTLEDVINELNTSVLRVGIHIQGFEDGTSESAVNVPEPATILLLSLGTLVLVRKRHKK